MKKKERPRLVVQYFNCLSTNAFLIYLTTIHPKSISSIFWGWYIIEHGGATETNKPQQFELGIEYIEKH